jgi:hypothetical protein
MKAQPVAEEKADNLRPLGLRLEPETIRQLRVAHGGKPGAKLSDEIRKRLRWTLDIDPVDDPTREFLKDVALLAMEIRRETGSAWHSHPGAHIAFRQAILSRLNRLEPKGGELRFGPRPGRTRPSDDPHEIGLWAEHDVNFTRNLSRKEREDFRREKVEIHQEIVRFQEEKRGGHD